ncbi:phosphonate metabolism transcriptional regulator PhnF [Pseudochelatococcus sp. B33]
MKRAETESSGRPQRGQWRAVEERISRDIASGVFAPGSRLPNETEIMQRFGVGRHTVRRAIAGLVAAGKVRVEQGRGTFVEEYSVIRYSIALRTRFNRNLKGEGRVPSGQPIEDLEMPAPPVIAAALHIREGAPVYMIQRRGFADSIPISYGRNYHPVARFPDIHLRRRESASMTQIYKDYGITDYVRHSTTIFTRLPTAEEARLLAQPPEQPVLAMQKVDVDLEGRPIAYSDGVWAGGRIQFVITHDDQPDEMHVDTTSHERKGND